MLKIALVANTYAQAKRWAEFKFKDKITRANRTNGTYTLQNGDIVYLCYGEQNGDRYISMEFDAIVVHPEYQSLLDVIRERSSRG